MAWKKERSINVGGKEWHYKIGGSVAIRSPEGKATFIKLFDFMKIMLIKPIVVMDDVLGDFVTKFPVHPSDIQRYIEKHILKIKNKEKRSGSQMAKVPMRNTGGQGSGTGDLPRSPAQQLNSEKRRR